MKSHNAAIIGKWHIDVFRNPNTGNLALRVWSGRHVDYPILKSDGCLSWDRPEAIPQSVQIVCRNMMRNRCRKYANLRDFEFLFR